MGDITCIIVMISALITTVIVQIFAVITTVNFRMIAVVTKCPCLVFTTDIIAVIFC